MAKQPLKKKEVKTSSFSDFKKANGFTTNIADKPIEWLEMPKGFVDALHINIPQGYVSIIAGHSNTGKSTLINHIVAAAQRQKLIPIIYDTENNFDFSYAKAVGFEAEPVMVVHTVLIKSAFVRKIHLVIIDPVHPLSL